MRRTRIAVAVAALGLVAAGCASGTDDGDKEDAKVDNPTAESSELDGAGKTLSVWIMEGTNPNIDPYLKELKTAFEDETGAKLDVQIVPWADAHDKFVKAIAAGTTPDVAEVGTTWTPEFADAGGLVDLTDAVSQAGLDGDLVAGLQEAGTVDGELYGMPWYAGVRSVVYRTDIFEKAGVQPPTTWEEMVEVGDKIEAYDSKLVTFPVPGDSEYGVDPFVWGNGGDIAVQDGDSWKSAIDSPEAQEGIEFYTGLATEHGFSTPAATTWDEADLSDAFSRGDVAMMISGSWTPAALVEANPDLEGKIGAFPIPGPDGGLAPSFLGGSHLGIFSDTEDADLSFALVRMMSTGELAEKWGSQTGFFPGTNTLLEQTQADGDPLVAPFAKQAVEAGKSVPVTPLYGEVQGKKTISAMLQSILSGDKSVAEASEDAADEMDQIFSRGD